MKIDEFNYDVVSIDLDSINQYLLDTKDNQGLKKLEQLSKAELQDIIFKVDDMFCNTRMELWQDFIYQVCQKIKEKK